MVPQEASPASDPPLHDSITVSAAPTAVRVHPPQCRNHGTRFGCCESAPAAMPKTRHKIWMLFEETAPRVKGQKDHPDAQCVACKTGVKNAVPSGNMLRHVLTCKSIDEETLSSWKQYEANLRHAKAESMVTPPKKNKKRKADSITRELFASPSPTLASSSRRQTPRSAGGTRSQRRPSKKRCMENFLRVAMGFYATGIPFRVVEDPIFRAMFDYELPSRRQLSWCLLDHVFDSEKARVVTALKDASDLAIVTDGWTNNNGDSIVNFVLVNPRFPSVFWKSMNTAAKMHTGEYIADTILTTIAEVEQTVGRKIIASVVTDYAPTMMKALKLVMKERPDIACAGCAAHGMNLVMKDILQLDYFKDVIANAKTLARFFRDRTGLWSLFRERQSQLRKSGDKRRRLSLPVPTRWYTHEKCIGNVVHNKDIIAALFSRNDLRKRYEGAELDEADRIFKDDSFWEKSEAALNLLHPVNDSLASFERDESSFSTIFNKFDTLQDLDVYTKPLEGCTSSVQSDVIDILRRRRTKMCTRTAKVAAFLEQNLTLDVLDEDSATMVEKAAELAVSMEIIPAGDKDRFHKELQKYATDKATWSETTKKENARFTPLNWWILAPKRFASIKPFATRILAIPTSSASSERNWSIHGFIHTKTRNRLSPERVNKLVFIYCNMGDASELNHIMSQLFPEACDDSDDSDSSDDEDGPIHIRIPTDTIPAQAEARHAIASLVSPPRLPHQSCRRVPSTIS